MSRRFGASTVVLTVALILVTTWAANRMSPWRTNKTIVKNERVLAPHSYSTPTPGPTSTLPPWAEGLLSMDDGTVDENRSVSEWKHVANVVAEVVVIRKDQARFDTITGAFPTEDPLGRNFGLTIFAPVVLQAITFYKGAWLGMEGFVVREDGGTLVGFSHRVEPRTTFTLSTHGIAFLSPTTREELQIAQGQLPPFHQHILEVADELGTHYEPASVLNYFEFNGTNAYSMMEATKPGSEWLPRVISIEQLLHELSGS